MTDSPVSNSVPFEMQETGVEAVEAKGHEESEEVRPTKFVFKEMLSEEENPIPTYDQLERFGLFDVSICSESLAEYRAKYPLPQEISQDDDSEEGEENLPLRPSPKHRHSIAITSLSPPSAYSPPLASPGLVVPNKLSPFTLARRTSRKARPGQPRTKSTNDVLTREAAVPPLLSPESDTSDRRSSIVSLTPSTTTEETPLASRANLDRDSTIKDKRHGPSRKLRKNPATRPQLPVIRTDDDYLLRPSAEFRSRSPSPARSAHRSSPSATTRKQGWRTSLSNLVSPASSPTTSFQMPHELSLPPPSSSQQPRSPSPIDSFPSTIRRESALPPVDRTNRPRNDSLSDSYFGDSENHRLPTPAIASTGSNGKRDRTRSSSNHIPSPSSPVSTGNLWARAMKLGRKAAGSKASSVASSSASTTSWDMVDGGEGASERGTFEVLRSKKVAASRPMARRTSSEGGGGATLSTAGEHGRVGAEGQILEASTSSPNLSKISEYPESLDQRSYPHAPREDTNPYRYLSAHSPTHSTDSFPAPSSQGFQTPPLITANSSKTILALGGTSTPSTISAARRVRSRSALSTSAVGELPQVPINERDLPPLPRSESSFSSTRSRADSDASTTYRSTHSSSQDSIFSRNNNASDEDESGLLRRAVSPTADYVDGGEETGATSVTEGEEEEDEAELLKRQLVIDAGVTPGVAI
ncbi:uncharacterized protein JCM6883_006614 [Sporobolomyces salmoneus]|uniref:uncharacterized protein n=1 Tax=Sporobolomyces salmoneus TaxID=183962 RepID=UPI0031746C90